MSLKKIYLSLIFLIEKLKMFGYGWKYMKILKNVKKFKIMHWNTKIFEMLENRNHKFNFFVWTKTGGKK